MEIKQNYVSKKIIFQNSLLNIKNEIYNGYNKKHNIFEVYNTEYDESLIRMLIKNNYLYNNNFINRIIIELKLLNDISIKDKLDFSAVIYFKSQYINVERCKDDFRCLGYATIILTNENKKDVYQNINIEKNLNKFLHMLRKTFYDLVIEIKKIDTINCENIQIYEKVLPIIFSPKAAGYLIHEVFGHMLESDFIINNMSIFKIKDIGEKVSDYKIKIVDDPYMVSNIGVGKIDDEGENVEKKILINNGIIQGFICNNTTSKLTNSVSCGFSRTDTYSDVPIPRMRTTYLDRYSEGKNLGSIIRSSNKALYVDKIYNGQINSVSGKFTLDCKLGYIIKNGDISNCVNFFTIQGNALEMLNSIEEIGSDLDFVIGHCLKYGQTVTVGMGSPSLKIKDLVVKRGYQ